MDHLDEVYELVGHQLEEVEIFLRLVFGSGLYQASVLCKHVEHGVCAVVDLAECFLDVVLLSLIAEHDAVDFVIELQLLFVVSLEVGLDSFLVVNHFELELACNLGDINHPLDSAFEAIVEELVDFLFCFFLVLQINAFKYLFLSLD